jgi:predicted  nucleic acid-binding Zn-ribbon protein
MKKATAFISLAGLLLILFGGLYLVKYYPSPQDFSQLIDAVKSLIKVSWQKPLMIGGTVFWLVGFLLSLMVLLEPSKPVAVAVTEAPKVAEEAVKTEEKPGISEEEFNKIKEELATAKTNLEARAASISDLEEQLKSAKESLSARDEDTSAEDEKAELNKALSSAKEEAEELNEKLKKLEDQATKVKSENEALIAKIENSGKSSEEAEKKAAKAVEDFKSARKEAEKSRSELNKLKEKAEADETSLKETREELEEVKKELQSALADAKSGKHGIPPAAYQILYLFQKEGRFIDLLMEDVSDFDDETLGGAIRPIHEGCRKILQERLVIEPVMNEEEGSEITVEEVDPESIKLSGNVPTEGPYTGELVHRGWRLKECNLPELVDGWSGNVIAPAEIEII